MSKEMNYLEPQNVLNLFKPSYDKFISESKIYLYTVSNIFENLMKRLVSDIMYWF